MRFASIGLQCSKMQPRGSVPGPAGGVYSAPPYVVLRGRQRRESEGKEMENRAGRQRTGERGRKFEQGRKRAKAGPARPYNFL